ncbi:hypothetical protein CR513_39226, partial [Mucuna pruriens]
MDVVTTYLYYSLDNDIYMKFLEGFKLCKTYCKGHLLTCVDRTISQRFVKQTTTTISFTNAKILALHRANREYVKNVSSTIIYEDNAACIAQLKEGHIKKDRTKHILSKFFFTYDLKKEWLYEYSTSLT